MDTPVLLLTFNRLDTVKTLLMRLSEVKPSKLYISSDGPRLGNSKDEIVFEIRNYIKNNVTWECKVNYLFQNKNLGCKTAVSRAITWLFQSEDRGIILEDDCLPSHSFFIYCETLLNRYSTNHRIWLISGYNPYGNWRSKSSGDYLYSRLGGIWGWATWRRAWINYTDSIDDLESLIDQGKFRHLLGDYLGKERGKMLSEGLRNKNVDSWAYRWALSRHRCGALGCVPRVNLIENIGLNAEATHTVRTPRRRPDVFEMNSYEAPEWLIPDADFDEGYFLASSRFSRLRIFLRKVYYAFVNF